ncbi:Ribonuclease 3 [Wickerhamomyces ciferrii]|uniref:Ribonuclease 3 n=1 Tax=Wickerhamomyces ciferrii (strain ATCC 14091 / BCRC 22168 / CBS 111 / JCM 3599 / NBRC 0793 / NRRL Y-1031 F-60-10) TaxID=1206466 RepID=K0KK28_WICCF|nr:Ribonuclease 3 [Wickerhamomyces ciferrii]CCH41814.1 Ribonuclease 3 [Wickerhamomyces ciferrii]
MSRHKLSDSDINDFIDNVTTKKQRTNGLLTVDDVASIGVNASQLADAISRIIEFPTRDEIIRLKNTNIEKRILYLLQSPEVALGLELKDNYDQGKLDVFERILHYNWKEGLDTINDSKMIKFFQECEYYLPDLPPIEDEELKTQVESNEGLDNLSHLGEQVYESIISTYLYQRFPRENIKEISRYTSNYKVLSRWGRLYDLLRDERTPPREVFLAYIGAIVSKFPTDENAIRDIEKVIYVLVEPILMQFEPEVTIKGQASSELSNQIYDLEIVNAYETTHASPLYVVQIYVAGTILIGTGVGRSPIEAENLAATRALLNPKHLEKAKKFAEEHAKKAAFSPEIEHSTFSAQPQPQPQPQAGYTQPQPQAGYTQPQPQSQYNGQSSYQASYQAPYQGSYQAPPPPQPQPQQQCNQQYSYNNNQYSYGQNFPTPQPSAASNPAALPVSHTYQDDPYNSALVHQPQAQSASSVYPQEFINQEYQAQLQREQDDVIQVPDVTDESTVEMSAKARLNEHLNKSRLPVAEYKTDKLNNSDVQVTCSIGAIPIVKATFANKKKAGQICAQYILDHWGMIYDVWLKKKERNGF